MPWRPYELFQEGMFGPSPEDRALSVATQLVTRRPGQGLATRGPRRPQVRRRALMPGALSKPTRDGRGREKTLNEQIETVKALLSLRAAATAETPAQERAAESETRMGEARYAESLRRGRPPSQEALLEVEKALEVMRQQTEGRFELAGMKAEEERERDRIKYGQQLELESLRQMSMNARADLGRAIQVRGQDIQLLQNEMQGMDALRRAQATEQYRRMNMNLTEAQRYSTLADQVADQASYLIFSDKGTEQVQDLYTKAENLRQKAIDAIQRGGVQPTGAAPARPAMGFQAGEARAGGDAWSVVDAEMREAASESSVDQWIVRNIAFIRGSGLDPNEIRTLGYNYVRGGGGLGEWAGEMGGT